MAADPDQYIDAGFSINIYHDRIFCHCPKCDRQAVVLTRQVGQISQARICCLSCTYQAERSPGKLFGAVSGVARQPCPTCGHQWLTAEAKATATSRLRETIDVACPTCQEEAVLDLCWHNDDFEQFGKSPVDPYFGCALWLQVDCCGNVLWVYNEKHLADLKAYIGSKLRDGRNRQKWSMISRLPQWMISAKNRDSVLKCLEKIEALLDRGMKS